MNTRTDSGAHAAADTRATLDRLAAERILVLDGAMGTMVQREGLTEADFRGERFKAHETNLAGCNDLLCLTKPDAISRIHERYLQAGADIIETCSFNATAVSLADYGLAAHAYEISRAAAALAKGAAARFSTADKPRFVAGVMGPLTKCASISPDMDDPGARGIAWDELEAAYYDNARGLLDGGADMLLIETVFDTLNAKAAAAAVMRLRDERQTDVPLMLSATTSGAAGRLLAGQTVEAFAASVLHAEPWSVGLNCSSGASSLQPYVAALSACVPCRVSAHPNAGLPNESGEYDETPESMAAQVAAYAEAGIVNVVGGCCGSTPAHIVAIAKAVRHIPPRAVPAATGRTVLAGLEPLEIGAEAGIAVIGERTNVSGSRRFLRLIAEDNYSGALRIARESVAQGARLIDICMDDALLDSRETMTRFVNLALSDPDIARVPFVLDSSRWDTLEAALKCVQGKALVNSVSLKEGEAEFLRRALCARRYGAAVVVMLFDEAGQAADYARKVELAPHS